MAKTRDKTIITEEQHTEITLKVQLNVICMTLWECRSRVDVTPAQTYNTFELALHPVIKTWQFFSLPNLNVFRI